jgi:hypothetical protein
MLCMVFYFTILINCLLFLGPVKFSVLCVIAYTHGLKPIMYYSIQFIFKYCLLAFSSPGQWAQLSYWYDVSSVRPSPSSTWKPLDKSTNDSRIILCQVTQCVQPDVFFSISTWTFHGWYWRPVKRWISLNLCNGNILWSKGHFWTSYFDLILRAYGQWRGSVHILQIFCTAITGELPGPWPFIYISSQTIFFQICG